MHNQPVRFRSIKARPNDAINEIGSKTWLSADEWSNNNNKFSEHRIAPATDTHISKLLSSLSCRYTLHLSYYNTACSKLNLKLLKLSSRLHTTTSRTSGYPQTEKNWRTTQTACVSLAANNDEEDANDHQQEPAKK